MSKEEFLKIQKCVLKVNIHCDGCKHKVKKILQKIDGVFTTHIDSEQGKVTVSGNVDPAVLIKKLGKSGKHAELWGAPKANNNNQSQLANQLKNMQIDNGKGGANNNNNKGGQKAGGGGGGANNQPKGGQQGGGGQQPSQQQPSQQQLQQLQHLQQLQQLQQLQKGFQDPKQLKGMGQLPPFKDPNQNQKAVKFNLKEDIHDLSEDDYDDDDDDYDDDDEFDDDEMEEMMHHPLAKKPVMGNGGQGGHPNMMMNGGHPGMMNVQKGGGNVGQNGGGGAAGGGNGKKGGGGGGGAVPVQVNMGGGNNGNGGKKGGGGGGDHNQNQGGKNGGAQGGGNVKNGNNGHGGPSGNMNNGNGGKKAGGGGGGGGAGGGVSDPVQAMNMAMAQMSGRPQGMPGGNMNMAMAHQMGGGMPMGQMGSIPAVQGLPAGAAMNGGGGYFQGAGPEAMPGNPYHQQQYLQAVMNQQRAMGNERFQPMMYARPPPAVNYMPAGPPPPYYPGPPPAGEPYTHFFSDENTSSCNIM